MNKRTEKIHFVSTMPDVFRRILGLSVPPCVEDSVDIEVPECVVPNYVADFGAYIAEIVAMKSVYALEKLARGGHESRVLLGAGAVALYDGIPYSVLKGSVSEAEKFYHTFSDRICSVHLCVAARTGMRKPWTESYETQLVIGDFDASLIERLSDGDSETKIDYLDVLLHGAVGSTEKSRMQWEYLLMSKFDMFLRRNFALLPVS